MLWNLYVLGGMDQMFCKGFVREVKSLSKSRFSKTASQAVGYKEIRHALRGEITFDDAKTQIKRNTRRLAKRQLTWFKREKGIQWLRCHKNGTHSAVQQLAKDVLSRIPTYKKLS